MPVSVCRPLRNIDAEGAKNRHEYLLGGVLPRNVSFRRMIERLSDSFPHAWGVSGRVEGMYIFASWSKLSDE